jgi:flagellar biosynthetic protein FliR
VLDLSPLAHFGLLLVRPGMLMLLAPGIGGVGVPAQARLGLTVLLALALFPSVAIPRGDGNAIVTAIIAREAVIGLSLAFVVRALIAGAEFAGHMSGFQIGFSYGATIDPQNGVNNTMLATFYGLLATLGFLAINGHHMLIRALAMSYDGLPIGMGTVNGSLVGTVGDITGLVFVVGVRLAAPVVIALLIVELAVGLISRTAPSLNFMIIGYPVRIILGLVLVAVLVPTIPSVTNAMIETVMRLALRTAAAFR